MNDNTTFDPVLVNEASRICEVCPETIRDWHRRGKLSALKTTVGVRVFDRRDVLRIAAERAAARRPAGASVGVPAVA
jgi:DNA-binding transcriptional MerR regulator